MKYYSLKPEVAGGWGPITVADTRVHPPVVKKLNYEFDGWLGDDILETFPCYIITKRLSDLLTVSPLTGYEIDDVVISYSETFMELYPNKKMPTFFWLKIIGAAGIEDFGAENNNRLVVSETVMNLLARVQIKYCDISDFK